MITCFFLQGKELAAKGKEHVSILHIDISWTKSFSIVYCFVTHTLLKWRNEEKEWRKKATKVVLECWAMSAADDIHAGYSKCHSVCPTRRPLNPPPGRDWNTDYIDETWMTGEYTFLQSREITNFIIQKKSTQHISLALHLPQEMYRCYHINSFWEKKD